MDCKHQLVSKPYWAEDELHSSLPPQVEAPYFDSALEAWVLSRHSDVLAAFQSPALTPAGPKNKKSSESPSEEEAHFRMRVETSEALTPTRLSEWRQQIAPLANALATNLSTDRPTELLEEFALPACLAAASIVTGADTGNAEHLQQLARQVSAAAAEPYDTELRARADAANIELRKYFHTGPWSLRDSGFVALSQTMPCLLANAWFALLKHPQQWSYLHRQPDLLPQAMEELLRYAGLTRVLFRRATEDTDLNGAAIKKGDRLILRLIAANRDPEHFPEPNRLDITRRGTGQLALGAGPHSCVGASLIRMVAIAVTLPLIERFATAELIEPVQWRGGSGFLSPALLEVQFSELSS